MTDEFRWGPNVEPWDCDLCGGLYDPPCPFHPEASPLYVLVAGLKAWASALAWDARRRQ